MAVVSINALKLRSLRQRVATVKASAAGSVRSGNQILAAELIALASLVEELVGELEAATLRGKHRRGEKYAPANTPGNKRARERLEIKPSVKRSLQNFEDQCAVGGDK